MQAWRNLLKFLPLAVDKICRLDAPALKCAAHCPETLEGLLFHAVDCTGNHALMVVVQLVENAFSLRLQELQVRGQWGVEAILRIKFKPCKSHRIESP